MSCGIPSIASNVSGIKDILAPFPELLFTAENLDSLTEKLENLIMAEVDKKKSYRKHILKKYDITFEVKNHEQIYKRILSIN